jgi:hypothetical protein
MLKLDLPQPFDDDSKADLDEMDAHLSLLLQPLLLGRFHSEVLRRWAYLRCCVASAQEGEYVAGLETMYVSVEQLAAVVAWRFGPITGESDRKRTVEGHSQKAANGKR